MAPLSPIVAKLKVQLKLSISRLRMTQQKDSALAKQARRSMAQLLETGKLESARIRVENIIRSDVLTELHEILELYCELLLARIQLLDSSPAHSSTSSSSPSSGAAADVEPIVDPALDEAVRSLIYAAPRTEIKELQTVRALLIEKVGKEAAMSAVEGVGIAGRVLEKLRLETPRRELVDGYLAEIARTYGVPFGESAASPDDDEDADPDDENDDGGGGGGGGAKEPPLLAEDAAKVRTGLDKEDELSRATPPRSMGLGSPVTIAPPSPSSDNVAPKVKGLPAEPKSKQDAGAGAGRIPLELKPGPKVAGRRADVGKGAAAAATTATTKPAEKKNSKDADDGPGGKIPDVDELARRFAALKK